MENVTKCPVRIHFLTARVQGKLVQGTTYHIAKLRIQIYGLLAQLLLLSSSSGCCEHAVRDVCGTQSVSNIDIGPAPICAGHQCYT